ncbi:MAG TPA: PhzF family phenazine biosynthesis protein [Steroidobacteraceae bacterium]|jgi:trans-2,3-dihydro-3-hydroxyanthranilate isomerase|nr:PhzF family phenazine biosynthesis protein [Steroidobacteraceae bacterium]
MAAYAYRLVNVFTQGGAPLSGNPLCVFERAQSLDTTRMQALALQFNLSETSFILPSERASARVRIFTPAYELAFAGHPTLGTAQVCRALGLGGDRLTLEMTAGIIPVRASGNRWTLQARAPTWREIEEPRLTIAAMLGLEERDIADRPLWVNAGIEQLVVPLGSEAAVRRVRVRADLLAQLQSVDGRSMAYVFAPAAGGLLARFFFPKGTAVLEDPATGSATASLGGWCLAMQRTLPCEYEIAQGEYTGRPSALRLCVDGERTVLVSGDVIELGRGTVNL